MIRLFRSILCVLLLSASSAVFAATDSFIIRTLIGDDTVPPSIPTGLVATPVALTQIDLTWASSTDDYIFSGYQVFRDDVQIATTTIASYSDVGLSASTTYSYYVTAFDSFNNFSASSTVVSTTTLSSSTPPTATTTPDGPRYGSIVRLSELVSLEIIPTQDGATIRYETRGYVRTIVKWGTTISYELGSIAERSFAKSHETVIQDLRPGTTYRLIIQGENNIGITGVLTETTFTTLPSDDTVPPGNVMNLTAQARGNDVMLSWTNPRDIDFDRVRVVRSDQFYPGDPHAGWVVYEGDAESAIDLDVFLPDTTLFYTVFTYDSEGNMSSGAVVRIGKSLPVISPDAPPTNSLNFTFDTIDFYQEGRLLIPETENSVRINGGQHLTIAVPYDRFPQHLKTILVTLVPQNDPSKVLSFLLRANDEKTAYTARLAPIGFAGTFSFTVSVFDFSTEQIGYTKGTLYSVISVYREDDVPFAVGFMDRFMYLFSTSHILIFIFMLILLAILSRRALHARW